MHSEFLMGNEAIALGALAAGVNLAAGYPGTPSTEILETLAKRGAEDIHVEWSVNEKAGLEVAAGAAYSGARALVTMKQVGLNVASDPLMSLAYIGVKGGMVIVVADDPGPISSQTEQDTRTFGMYAKIPVFDPSSVEEAYEMIQEAFDFSERYGTPVIFRPTTRIDHAYASFQVKDPDEYDHSERDGFVKDSSRWVIFPKLSLRNHAAIEKRNQKLTGVLSHYSRNRVIPAAGGEETKRGIAANGISSMYVKENLPANEPVRLFHVATPFPFPEEMAVAFLDGLDEVLCVEELDPVIERALLAVCGKYHLPVRIRGKLTGDMVSAGENTVDSVGQAMRAFLAKRAEDAEEERPKEEMPALPVRPPVLCAGCPHRASFLAVKEAMKGKKTIYCGDIGCYTLGNAAPLDMCDTCLCMGAGINIAQGVFHMDPEVKCFAFVGDSTFFASGITGIINAFYNQADMTLVVLDNSTTAMTGHQPHPGTGRTIRDEVVQSVSIEKVLRAIGLQTVVTMNPFDFPQAIERVREVAEEPGVKAILFQSPCVVRARPTAKSKVDAEQCIGCQKCIRQLGCPALILHGKKAFIEPSLCTGCTLCESVCPVHAISGGQKL